MKLKVFFVFTIVYFLITSVRASVQQNADRIGKWAAQLSLELHEALEENFGLADFQSLIDEALYKTISAKGNEFLSNITLAVDRKLKHVIRTLISNKELLESLQKDQFYAVPNCCNTSQNAEYNSRFKYNVDMNSSCAINSAETPFLTSTLDVIYKRNALLSQSIKWQYFGSVNASYHQFPSSNHHCSKEETYDPRLSSWYVDAAMSARKKLVIIIDKSGSMVVNGRMALAKDAAETVLNTLTPDDYGKNIILFLTDGEPSDNPNTQIYPLTAQKQQEMNNTVSILAYGLGTGISRNHNAKTVLTNIAQQNRGHFTIIQDGSREKLNSAFGSYYQYFVTANGNIARGKPATQSSVLLNQVSNLAVNGKIDGRCSQTTVEPDPWWKVDLLEEYDVMAVSVSNCCKITMRYVDIFVGNNANKELNKKCGHISNLADKEDQVTLCDMPGRYVHLSVSGNDKSLALCEVRVYQMLAPSSTLAMPCTNEDDVMFGVSAVDMSLNDVFSEINSFSYGQYSFAVLIDVKGRVWVHPRSPDPESNVGPSLLPLEIYESWASERNMKTILSQLEGQIMLKKILLQFPRGYSKTDGMATKTVNGSVYWKRIRNMFILIIGIIEDDFNAWLVPKQVQEEKPEEEMDKNIEKTVGVCQVNGTSIFTQLSTVKLTSTSNQGTNETTESHVFVGASTLSDVLEKTQVLLHPGMASDVIITGHLETKWRESDTEDWDSIMWRYVATESGVYRRFPGITLTENLNHKNTPWYCQGKLNPGEIFLSHSFDDPYGRGRVISITKAVSKRHHRNNVWRSRVMFVTGIDMAFSSFTRMAMNVMPGCFDNFDCFLMDQSGYLFLNLNEHESLIHVTEKFSWIGKQLVETWQILKPKWCNNFQDFSIDFSYEAVIAEKIISQSPLVCRQYALVPLPNISSSLLVVPSRRIYLNCRDKLRNTHVEACYSSEVCRSCSEDVKDCQTPCSCPMSFDRCSNSIMSTFTRITCPAPTSDLSLVNARLSHNNFLNSFKLVMECEKVCNTALKENECSEMSHCSWCENILSSCESFCPFNKSQRIGLKFTLDVTALTSVLTNNEKTQLKENLQQTMYNVLGEKLENNIHDVNFKKNSVTLSVQGSSFTEIYEKLDNLRDAIKTKTLFIEIPENGGTRRIFPTQIIVLDIDECLTNVHTCHVNATCFDTEEFFNCSCDSGFLGNGRNCSDLNECDQFPCDGNATCVNEVGSFHCSCVAGFTGNGFNCSDINECDQIPCHTSATCSNTLGSFKCTCVHGFFGDGISCKEAKATELKTRGTTEVKTTAHTGLGTTEKTETPKTGESTKTLKPIDVSSLDKFDDRHPTFTVIVLVITSFVIGISSSLCCIWFVLLRRSRHKNKVHPSAQSKHKVSIIQRDDKLFLKDKPSNENKNSTQNPKQSFQVVSNVTFQLAEVEI